MEASRCLDQSFQGTGQFYVCAIMRRGSTSSIAWTIPYRLFSASVWFADMFPIVSWLIYSDTLKEAKRADIDLHASGQHSQKEHVAGVTGQDIRYPFFGPCWERLLWPVFSPRNEAKGKLMC